MHGSPPPPPPANYRHASQPKPAKNAENYGQKQATRETRSGKFAHLPYGHYVKLMKHAVNPPTPKKRHTNRLKARKQAKQRAKRKSS